MNTPFRKNEPIQVKVEDERLVISIGIHTLSYLALGKFFETSGYPDLEVTTDEEFAKDIARTLKEGHDDYEMLVNLFEDAACQAYDSGVDSLVEQEDPFADEEEDEELEDEKDLEQDDGPVGS